MLLHKSHFFGFFCHAAIDILRMTILHPDGAGQLLEHVKGGNGIKTEILPCCHHPYYADT